MMNHIARIHTEFLKEARKWDDLTREEQKAYLKRHPASKRRITARPGKTSPAKGKSQTKTRVQKEKSKALKTKIEDMKGASRLHSRLASLEKLVDKNDVNRQKMLWTISSGIRKDKRPTGGKPKNYGLYDSPTNKALAEKLDVRVNKIIDAFRTLDDKYGVRDTDAINYIKATFAIERDVAGKKAPKSVRELKDVKPKRSKVVKPKKTKTPEYVSSGDRVSFTSSRRGTDVEGTITGVKHGRKYIKYLVETDDGAHWWVKRGSSGYKNSGMKYLGATAKPDAQRLTKNRREFDQAIDHSKRVRTDEGRERLQQLGVTAGSKIKIRGTHYNWDAEVVDVDYRKGGVRINQERTRRKRSNPFTGAFGGVTTHYRFIPARHIVSVEK